MPALLAGADIVLHYAELSQNFFCAAAAAGVAGGGAAGGLFF